MQRSRRLWGMYSHLSCQCHIYKFNKSTLFCIFFLFFGGCSPYMGSLLQRPPSHTPFPGGRSTCNRSRLQRPPQPHPILFKALYPPLRRTKEGTYTYVLHFLWVSGWPHHIYRYQPNEDHCSCEPTVNGQNNKRHLQSRWTAKGFRETALILDVTGNQITCTSSCYEIDWYMDYIVGFLVFMSQLLQLMLKILRDSIWYPPTIFEYLK